MLVRCSRQRSRRRTSRTTSCSTRLRAARRGLRIHPKRRRARRTGAGVRWDVGCRVTDRACDHRAYQRGAMILMSVRTAPSPSTPRRDGYRICPSRRQTPGSRLRRPRRRGGEHRRDPHREHPTAVSLLQLPPIARPRQVEIRRAGTTVVHEPADQVLAFGTEGTSREPWPADAVASSCGWDSPWAAGAAPRHRVGDLAQAVDAAATPPSISAATAASIHSSRVTCVLATYIQ